MNPANELPQRRRRASPLARIEDQGQATDPLVILTDGLADVRSFQAAAFAPNTRRGWATEWATFNAWCATNGHRPLPAEPIVVALYLARAAKMVDANTEQLYAVATLRMWLSTINKAHEMKGFPKPGEDPEVNLLMRGIARESTRKPVQKDPLLLDPLRQVLRPMDMQSPAHGPISRRDWVMLVFGFVGAYRRSELASLNIGDVTRHETDGLHVMLRRGKTDQAGKGFLKALPYAKNPLTCAPCAFTSWIRLLAIPAGNVGARSAMLQFSCGEKHICRERLPELYLLDPEAPLLRPVMKSGTITDRRISGNVVNDVVQRRMRAAGLDSSNFAAHSLRAGFVTQSFREGATHHEVMRQTGHRNPSTVEIYGREHNPLMSNSVVKLSL